MGAMLFYCFLLCAALVDLLNHGFKIGIASAPFPCEPVSTALGDSLAISDYIKLTRLAGHDHCVNAEPILDEGHETRDLGFVVLSRRTGNYFDLQLCPPRTAYLIAIPRRVYSSSW